MTTSVIAVTEGSGKNIWTDSRSVVGVTKEAQYTLLAPSAWTTYTACATGVATTTSAAHLIAWNADGTNYGRLIGLVVEQAALAGAAATAQLQVYRLTTLGSGGGTVNARPTDGADTDPFGGSVLTLNSSKGTEGNLLLQKRLGLVAAQPVNQLNRWEWTADSNMKPIIIGTATSSGLALKIVTGIATSTVDITLTFEVTTFL